MKRCEIVLEALAKLHGENYNGLGLDPDVTLAMNALTEAHQQLHVAAEALRAGDSGAVDGIANVVDGLAWAPRAHRNDRLRRAQGRRCVLTIRYFRGARSGRTIAISGEGPGHANVVRVWFTPIDRSGAAHAGWLTHEMVPEEAAHQQHAIRRAKRKRAKGRSPDMGQTT